jgi:hypothetical protein
MLLSPWLFGWMLVAAQTPVRVQVVDAEGEQPVAGAEVSWLWFDESQSFWASRLPQAPQLAGWYEMHRTIARKATCDASGFTQLGVEGKRAAIAASAPGLFGTAKIEGAESETVLIRLKPDRRATVRVRDGDGGAVAGVSVGARVVASPMFLWWGETGADGTASIEHTQEFGEVRLEFVFGFPCDSEPTDGFEATAGDASLDLALPPTGSVVVDLAGTDATAARLRRPGEFQGQRRPGLVLAKDGKATFPQVGLGLDLEVELAGSRSAAPQVQRFRGPGTAGQVVAVSFASSGAAVLRGRLTSWSGQPVTSVSATLEIETESQSSSRGVPFSLDETGAFEWTLPLARPPGGTSRLELHHGSESVSIELDPLIAGSKSADLGVVRLEPPIPEKLRTGPPLSDDDLEALFWRLIARRRRNFDHSGYEACLSEMARRGGERWIRFLAGVIPRCQADEEDPDSPFEYHDDFELWLALRRAERKPDPLILRANVERGVAAAPFPELPVVTVEIANVDQGNAAPWLLDEESDAARRERIRVEGTSPDGAVMRRHWPSWSGSIWSGNRRLAPGDRLRWTCDLAEYLVPDFTSEATVRIQYQESADIANEASLDDRLFLESAPFVVRWTPRTLSRAAVEAVDVQRHLEEIGPSAPPVIATYVYRSGMRWAEPGERGHQRLLSCGWNALPGLIDSLSDAEATFERRAWLLALLYDLTGVLDPRRAPGAIERWRETPGFLTESESPWRGSIGEARSGPRRDDASQRMLIERWLALRKLLHVQDR